MANIVIIGGGNIGCAIASGFIGTNHNIIIKTPNPNKINHLPQNKNIAIVSNFNDINISSLDYIIFAVKPNILLNVISESLDFINRYNAVIISVAAGISYDDINNILADKYKLIRAMPNTPIAINNGLIGYYSQAQDTDFEEIFTALGKVIYLESEDKIHDFTAIAGSGPAYIFHIMEAMILASENLGFSHGESLIIIRQLLLGSALLGNTDISPDILRQNVTSKGGTTFAGLSNLMGNTDIDPQQSRLTQIFLEVFLAAKNRSIELFKIL